MANLIQTTAPLGAGATYTSAVIQLNQGLKITGSVFADQPGTVYIEQSGDGTDFDISTSYTVTANLGEGFDENFLLPYIRIRFTNTGAAQTLFRLFANVLTDDGLWAQGAIASGVNDSTYLSCYWDGGKYVVVGTFTATSGDDANSQAALQYARNGKYVSFPVTSGAVDQVNLIETSQLMPASF